MYNYTKHIYKTSLYSENTSLNLKVRSKQDLSFNIITFVRSLGAVLKSSYAVNKK